MKGTTNVPDVVVVIRKENKILLVERQHTGYQDGKFCAPGGHVEPGESFSAAAVRETLEETGLVVKSKDLRPIFTVQRIGRDPDDIRVGVVFEVTSWAGEPKNMEPERHGQVAWFPVDGLKYSTIIDFHAEVLKALQRGETYIELGWKE